MVFLEHDFNAGIIDAHLRICLQFLVAGLGIDRLQTVDREEVVATDIES